MAALVVAACGGSSSGPLARAQLAAKVNDACRTYVKASTAVPQPTDFATNPAAAASYLQKLKPLVEAEHATISRLKPTREMNAQFARFQAASGHQLALFENALAKTRAGNRGATDELLAAARYKASVLRPLEHSLGFGACER